jgi:hypothetical protein
MCWAGSGKHRIVKLETHIQKEKNKVKVTFHAKPEFASLWGSNFPLAPHICF